MHIAQLLLPFLGAVLAHSPVLAQLSQPTASSSQSTVGSRITQLQPDQWQTSKLEGLDIYSSNNGDKIGDIRDLIFDGSGKVQAVVIGIGGYLGLSERDIAVPFDQIRFVSEPRVNTPGATTGEARLMGTNTGGGTVASPAATGTVAVPAAPNSAVASNTASNNAPVPGAPGALGQAAHTRSDLPPDHGILLMSVTKDELRAAPEFRDAR